MSVPECIFCKIIAGQIPCTKLYENEHVLAFLDIGPISEGHTLVIPKHHSSRMHSADGASVAELFKVVPELAASVQQAMRADGYNILCNNGAAAGQVVEHTHVHIIPRKEGDGVFNRWPSFEYPAGAADAIAEKIRKNISL